MEGLIICLILAIGFFIAYTEGMLGISLVVFGSVCAIGYVLNKILDAIREV